MHTHSVRQQNSSSDKRNYATVGVYESAYQDNTRESIAFSCVNAYI